MGKERDPERHLGKLSHKMSVAADSGAQGKGKCRVCLRSSGSGISSLKKESNLPRPYKSCRTHRVRLNLFAIYFCHQFYSQVWGQVGLRSTS